MFIRRIQTFWICLATVPTAFGAAEFYSDFEGANGRLDSFSNRIYNVKYEMRDSEGWWFNYRFGVRGAPPCSVNTFELSSDTAGVGVGAVGEAGTAYSLDSGKTWRYGFWEKKSEHGFTFAFHRGYTNVQFAGCLQYDRRHFKDFLAAQRDKGRFFCAGVLAVTRGGRKVPLIRLGNLVNPKIKLFFSSRHHANEAVATYAIEGIAAAALGDTELGEWIRRNVEIILVPFVDLDGVVAGDQGKNRKPWDHCRDYHLTRAPIYPEVAAIQKLILEEKPDVIMDLHNPWVREDEYLHQVGLADENAAAKQTAFAKVLQCVQEAGFDYRAEEDILFGQRWNTGKCFEKGMTLVQWAVAKVGKDAKLITSWEIPFCKAHKKPMTDANFRALGRDLLLAVRRSYGKIDNWYEDDLVVGGRNVRDFTVRGIHRESDGRYVIGGRGKDGAGENAKFGRIACDLSTETGRYVCVAFKAKGAGALDLTTSWAKGDRVLQTLGQRLLPDNDLPFRVILGPVPSGACDLGLHLSTDGYAEIQEPAVVVLDAKPSMSSVNPHQSEGGVLPAGCVVGRTLPLPEGETDLARCAEFRSLGMLPSRLEMVTDGALGTYERAPFVLSFEKPVSVTGFRLTLPPRAMEIYADTDGDGQYETELYRNWNHPVFGTWQDLREYVWLSKRFSSAIRLRSVLVNAGGIREFQLLGPEGQSAGLPVRPALKAAKALLSIGERLEKQPEPPSDKDRLWYGFCLEPWMFGVQSRMTEYFNKGTIPGPLADWKEWKALSADFHELHANFVLLFPPSVFAMPKGAKPAPGDYPHPIMWPSKVWYLNQPLDLLSQFNEACHKEGFLDFVIPRGWLFTTNRTEEVKQVTLAREIATRGSDGVPMCVDEQMFGMPLDLRKNASLRDEFFRWSGQTNMPAPAFYGDDKATRLAYLFSVHKKAEWMAQIKKAQVAANPKALTFGGFGGCDCSQIRTQNVSGADYWGWEGLCDVIGGDGTYFGVGIEEKGVNLGTLVPAVQTAVQVSCTPKRKSLATVNFNWGTRWDKKENRLRNPLVYDDFPNIAHVGGALATYFNKGEYLDYWRYNFMDMKAPTTRTAVKAGGFMTEVLGAWGGKKAEIPKDVLVLRSRTSEDWWSLKWRYGKVDPKLPRNHYQHWPHHLFFWTTARLAENALPFEIYQLQRPEAWKDIAGRYKVIVLPFAYSVSDEEADALRAAAQKGAKIVVLGGAEAGQVDAIGEPRPTNAFANIPIVRFSIADAQVPATRKQADDFIALMRGLIGTPSLAIETEPGYDVQAFALAPSDTERIVMVANWSERAANANLCLAMPDGKYRMEVCTEEDVREGMIDGKRTVSAAELSRFRIELKPEQTLMFRLRKKGFFE